MTSPLQTNDRVGFRSTSKFYGKEGVYLARHSETVAKVKLQSGSIVYPAINSIVPIPKRVVDDLNQALVSLAISDVKMPAQTQVRESGFSVQKDGVNVLLRDLIAEQNKENVERLLSYFVLFVVCRASALRSDLSRAIQNVKQLPFFLRQAFEVSDNLKITIGTKTLGLNKEVRKLMESSEHLELSLNSAARSALEAAIKLFPTMTTNLSSDIITRLGLAFAQRVIDARDERTADYAPASSDSFEE